LKDILIAHKRSLADVVVLMYMVSFENSSIILCEKKHIFIISICGGMGNVINEMHTL